MNRDEEENWSTGHESYRRFGFASHRQIFCSGVFIYLENSKFVCIILNKRKGKGKLEIEKELNKQREMQRNY